MSAVQLSLKRRWQRGVLRVHGYLDGDGADRLLPWTMAIVLFAVLAALSLSAIYGLEGGSGLGPWIQAGWRRQHGGAGQAVAGIDPSSGTFSLASEPLLLLGRVLPIATVLAVFQAFVIAAGVVPLWRLARQEAHLRVGATATIALAYALAPTLHRTNLTSFHPEVIALPALMSAYLHARRANWWIYSLMIALAMSARGDIALSVAALGVVVALRTNRRAGLLTAGVGFIYTIAAVVIVNPSLPDHALTPSGEFVARSQGPLAVLPQVLSSPLEQLRLLTAEPSVGFLVVVLAPVLFLPLVAPRRMVVALVGLSLAMIADTAVQEAAQRGVVNLSPAAAHMAPAMAMVFVALIFALERIGQVNVTRVNVDRRVLVALACGAILLFLTESPTSPYRSPWNLASRDQTDLARIAGSEEIEPDEVVASSPRVLALVSERARLIELPLVPADLSDEMISTVSAQVDAVFLDTSGVDSLTKRHFWSRADRSRVVGSFADAGFEVTYDEEEVLVLKK